MTSALVLQVRQPLTRFQHRLYQMGRIRRMGCKESLLNPSLNSISCLHLMVLILVDCKQLDLSTVAELKDLRILVVKAVEVWDLAPLKKLTSRIASDEAGILKKSIPDLEWYVDHQNASNQKIAKCMRWSRRSTQRIWETTIHVLHLDPEHRLTVRQDRDVEMIRNQSCPAKIPCFQKVAPDQDRQTNRCYPACRQS